MASVASIAQFLDTLAPPPLAESWDNVGLLVGDGAAEVARVMTCLTITAETVAEVVEAGAELVVTHHPLPFRPLQRITADRPEGRYLLDLISTGVAVYSAHTAFDSAAAGINQQLATGLGLIEVAPLVPLDKARASAGDGLDSLGAGRHGRLPAATTLGALLEQAKKFLDISAVRYVGNVDERIERVAVACGSAGEFLEPARQAGCEILVTGETSFHTCLEAEATGVFLVLLGHFASERFALDALAAMLAKEFSDLDVWASRQERDPIRWSD
ncbi:MAG: Nif3-like dinuclear metal center hexameric protein [Planctomycetota bacterium]|nr:MAG: Nif3-like dinuclear metal center hexameric protein [Planctomycetota bacterium]REK45844.1 MAG: Nif3-like dinuclear metal center hexameric protein [Planctomycetota bacterium]